MLVQWAHAVFAFGGEHQENKRGGEQENKRDVGQQECHYHWKAIALDFVEPTKKMTQKGNR
jgi:hypothetical protein